jgi:hypothetical protein
MMNDMMPTIEEAATSADLAQIEHQEWERGNEERERWEALEADHGPLLTKLDLENYHKDMEEICAEAWFEDGPCK